MKGEGGWMEGEREREIQLRLIHEHTSVSHENMLA